MAEHSEKEYQALQRAHAECQRKGERRAREIIALMDKNHKLQYEVRRLEELLLWVRKTDATDYKEVIARKLPNAVRRAETVVQ